MLSFITNTFLDVTVELIAECTHFPGLHARISRAVFLLGHSELPRGAHRAAQHFVGFCVVHESLPGRVPFQLPPEHHGDVADVSDSDGAMAIFSGVVAVLARLHAVKEIAVLATGAGVKVRFLGADLRDED
jgi:hypothetical protein